LIQANDITIAAQLRAKFKLTQPLTINQQWARAR